MAVDHDTLGRASLLAGELIDICRSAGKPLAADFMQAGFDYLIEGTGYERVIDRWPDPIKDRAHES